MNKRRRYKAKARRATVQRFEGWVDDMEGRRCWLRMRDRTEPSNPDEVWEVRREQLPFRVERGRHVRFIVTRNGHGAFEASQERRWTIAELEYLQRHAGRLAARLGIPA